jgi:glyoxylase-like metal-dependent hydrolase (beta-lactamase superfamily II)
MSATMAESRTRLFVALVALCAAAGATGPVAQAPPPLRLYVFDGGVLESDPGRYLLTPKDVAATQLSIASFLVVHPRGVLLWDTAAVPDGEWTPTGRPVIHQLTLPDGQPRQVTLRATLGAQLKAAGFAPREVTHLALSHYHWDHSANTNAVATAQWLVRPAEREAMFAEKPVGAVRTELFAALKQSRTTLLQQDEHDVFGDGAVVVKAAPGHTPGHQVLLVKLPKTGPVLLSGDLYHYPEERTLNRMPPAEEKAGQTPASRKAVEAFLQRTGAQLWIQHDLTAHRRLRLSPEFYD